MKPTVIGIGAQKCASSWVHSVLGAHPEIGVSDPKEVDFFSYYFDRGYAWYEKHFDLPSRPQIRFESSPSYFYDPRSAQRAQKYEPDLRVVAILRDPVARAFSNHLHEVVKGHIPALTFEEGLANNPTYIDQSRYATHLKRWMQAFGRKQILVMFAEDIAASPEVSARQLYQLVGANPDYRSSIANESRNVSDRARSPALRKALQTGGDLMRRAGMEEILAQAKSSAPVAELLRQNSIHTKNEIPPMSSDARQRLLEIFAPEMEDLSKLLKRKDFPWESWSEITTRA